MDVMSVEQARIAEEAGACAVMVLEKIPSLIRQHGGVARTVSGLPIVALRPDADAVVLRCSPTRPSSRLSRRPSRFPSWPRSASATLLRRRSCSTWVSITLMVCR